MRKILAILHLKGLDYEIDPITPFYGNDEFSKLSPLRRIPVLVDGDLVVTLLNAFTPASGATFNLFDAATFTGSFATVSLPTLTAGLTWDTSGLYSAGILSVTGTAIPEPSTYAALAGLAALGLAAWRRRCRLRE